ncbi:MAG TPA: hypothetical protein VMT89_18545 [Candidatus Acidoferrales bacterium]|nr:hypothetical protein [Candidatus Acidoferrales bacterium]
MRFSKVMWWLLVSVFGLVGSRTAFPQEHAPTADDQILPEIWTDLMLTTKCEEPFKRLIRLAETGRLGEDVNNANVDIRKNSARLELVGAQAPHKVFRLTPRNSSPTLSRYFNIEPSDGAAPGDVARLAKALDEVFEENPFELSDGFLYGTPGGDSIPGFIDAWRSGGWRFAIQVLVRRTAALAGIRYAIAVISFLVAGCVGSVILLCGSPPPGNVARDP